MKQKKKKRIVSVVLCIVLLLAAFSGCGNKKTKEKPADIQTETQGAEAVIEPESVQSSAEEEEQSAPTTYVPLASGGQGRYVEEELENLRECTEGMKVTREGVWVFGPNEAVFRQNGSDEFQTVSYPSSIRETYWTSATVNDEGDMVFACYEEDQGGYATFLQAVKKDGTVVELERIENEFVGDMEFGPDGKLYVHRYGENGGIYCYELEEKQGERLFYTSSVTDDLTFMGNLLLAVDDGQVWIYDIENNMQKEQDSVLDAFCKENIDRADGYSGIAYEACIFGSEEENVLYLVCEKGIFRHVLYGGIMEQVANGELNMLSDPANLLQGAGAWEDENGNVAFLVDMYPGRVMRYVYDPDTPTVPEVMLRVYSLEENPDLRQIITLFQQEHPECYVKYEVGLSGAGAANVEDKIKQLNTAILSGNGPDILLTDGLDERNYIDKGVLLDLSGLAEGMTGEDALAPNLVDALRQDGKIYSLPVMFCIPMIAGEEEFVESVHDITSLTAGVEQARGENEKGVILTSAFPEAILSVLAQTESGKWVKDGNLDEEALREFLSCAYRLYEAERKGIGEEIIEAEQKELEESAYISASLPIRLEKIYFDFDNTLVRVMFEEKLAAIGYAGNPIELRWVDQLPENYDFAPLEDGQGVGFKPVMKLAVNVASSQQEMAQDFVRTALSAKAGKLGLSNGIPLNIAAAEWAMKDHKHMAWCVYGTNYMGKEVEVNGYWPLQRTLEKYQEAIGSVNHVIEENSYLKRQVIEIGGKAMQEGKSIDEAVEEIKKKTAFYLAE